jgi:DNA (cytosine-5)-methyltransferase 1
MQTEKRLISLFSGAGGMDIGFHRMGFRTCVAVEQDSSCCNTLRQNMPDVPVLEGDICTITSEQILKAGNLKALEADVLIGGPPCQSFSLAGKRMGMDDPRGLLVLQYLRVVRDCLPKVFVMENVKGLVNWSGGSAIRAILDEATRPVIFEGNEYRYVVKYKVLNAANFGVAQYRERVFIIGNRLDKEYIFPAATHENLGTVDQSCLFDSNLNRVKTVWDAIGDLPPATEPSEVATRVSETIKERIKNHGY